MVPKRSADEFEPGVAISVIQIKHKWKAYEKRFYEESIANTIKSNCCNQRLLNKYAGGNSHASGIQLTRLQCSGCFTKHTMKIWLENSSNENADNFLATYNAKFQELSFQGKYA